MDKIHETKNIDDVGIGRTHHFSEFISVWVWNHNDVDGEANTPQGVSYLSRALVRPEYARRLAAELIARADAIDAQIQGRLFQAPPIPDLNKELMAAVEDGLANVLAILKRRGA